MTHEMKHSYGHGSESRPSDTLGVKWVFRGTSPVNSTGIQQSVMREDIRGTVEYTPLGDMQKTPASSVSAAGETRLVSGRAVVAR
jgi:hypothetical protein